MRDTSGDTFRVDADRKDLGPGQEEMKSTQGVRLGGYTPTSQSRCRYVCTAQHQREGKWVGGRGMERGVGGAWEGVGGAWAGASAGSTQMGIINTSARKVPKTVC